MNYYYMNLENMKRIDNGISDGSITLLDPPKPKGEASKLTLDILREISNERSKRNR